MERNETFIQHLYKEKEIHKEHRHKHVIYKLILTGSFFGSAQFSGSTNIFHLFLYVVPIIALVHDMYIFAEDFKVKRVGFFFREIKKKKPDCPVCDEEISWEEDYLKKYREKWAYRASLLYTIIITIFSAFTIYLIDFGKFKFPQIMIYLLWIAICIVLIIVVFIFAKTLRKRIVKIEEELSQS